MIAVFGATGFTGNLVCRALAERRQAFVAAGRTMRKLRALDFGPDVSLERREAQLEHRASLDAMLQGCQVLINCAGPFTELGPPVVEAALRNGVHYLDTTGEQGFMRWARGEFGGRFEQAGLVLAPAMAYEYAAGDCAAALAVEAGVRRLGVVYASWGMGTSHGTKKSIVQALIDEGVGFFDGREMTRRPAEDMVTVDLGDGKRRRAFWFPGGEPVTVPRHSPRATRVDTYLVLPRRVGAVVSRLGPLLPGALERAKPVLDRLIEGMTSGDPHEAANASRARCAVLGLDLLENRVAVKVSGGDAYAHTAQLIAEAATRLLAADQPPQVGFSSAAALFEPREFLEAAGFEIKTTR